METREVYPSEKRAQFINVKDALGNEYICPAEALRTAGHATAEELKSCIDESRVSQPFAGG